MSNKIQPTNDQWVKDLKQNDYIWLVKESTVAVIDDIYDEHTGTIIIRTNNTDPSRYWYVRPNGTGFDHKPLIEPMQKITMAISSETNKNGNQYEHWIKEVSEFKGKKAKSLWPFDGTFSSYYQPITEQTNSTKEVSEFKGKKEKYRGQFGNSSTKITNIYPMTRLYGNDIQEIIEEDRKIIKDGSPILGD